METGFKLGPYEIVSAAGAGGMGEVYKGRDTRLDRTVAIKVLPAHLSSTPEMRVRFEREAKAISALQHPHVCTLYDIGRQDGRDFLVMEFLEGETLEQRIARGPLPPNELLRVAIQVANALEKAHRAGLIHRDLKPGNVMLTKTGAKLMDFGLAKSMEQAPVAAALNELTAETKKLTAEGTILGTFQYMAPEQLEGDEADARTDIFAFGTMLYEMATGQPPFKGRTKASLIASILSAEPPPIATLQPLTPPTLERVVRICLAKDPDERFQSVHDLRVQLEWIAEGGSQAGVPAPVVHRRKNRERLAWALAAVLLVALAAAGYSLYRYATAPVHVLKAALVPPEKLNFVASGQSTTPAPSPDGTRVAFVAGEGGHSALYIESLDSLEPRLVPNTEGALYPFWSPDGIFVAFFADGNLRKVEANGGTPRTVCTAADARGGTWGKNGDIVFSNSRTGPLLIVAAQGGAPREVTKLHEHETSHRWPSFLPDGKHFVYLSSPTGADSSENAVWYGSIDGKEERQLLLGSSSAIYSREHLLFWREGSLYAQPFDAAKGTFRGEAFPIASGVTYDVLFSHAIFAASPNGVLIYQSGPSTAKSQAFWYDRKGKQLAPVGEAAIINQVSTSPDGKTVGLTLLTPGGTLDVWLFDERGVKTRFTFSGSRNGMPNFTPDGRTIYYISNQNGKSNIYRKPADGSSAETLVLAGADKFALRVSADGKYLTWSEFNPTTKLDVFALSLAPGSQPTAVANSNYDEVNASLSPDSRWLIYQSNEAGKVEIYATPFLERGAKFQVSSGGGYQPLWSPDGKEIYFLSPSGAAIMSVPVQEQGSSLVLGAAREALKVHVRSVQNGVYYLARDGRVLVNVAGEDSSSPIIVVSDWLAAAKH